MKTDDVLKAGILIASVATAVKMSKTASSRKNPSVEKCFAVVSGIPFSTKKALEDYIKDIIAQAPKGWLRYLPPEQEAFVKDLIETRYDKYEEKIGDRGLSRVFVDKNVDFPNTNCFYIVRGDNSVSDISWKACLTARTNSGQTRRAFRTAIVSQILDFKTRAFSSGEPLYCPYTKELLTWENCDVDHVAPKTFEFLFGEFLRLKNLSVDDIVLTQSQDLSSTKSIADPALKAEWQSYHYHNADLRPLSKLGNMSHARKS